MNFNDYGLLRNRGRGRGRGGRQPRGRVNSVTVQKPLMGPPKRPVPKRNNVPSTSSSSTHLVWKTESCRSFMPSVKRSSTSRSSSILDSESRIVIALSEGRGEARYEVGIAAIDVSLPSLTLCQISDSQSYVNTLTKINILNPSEILIPMTFLGTRTSNRLIEKIKERFKDTLITAVPRSTFNKADGIQFVKELCAPQWNSVLLVLQHKYYALAATSALLTYAERVLYILYAHESVRVEYQESEGFAFIDVATADRLELVASTNPTAAKKFTSLYGVLNHCLTRVGSRTLRSSILQPPCSVPDIEARLECVTELKRNPDLLYAVQNILTPLANVDRLLSMATIVPNTEENYSERQLNYILMMNVLLEAALPLKDALKGSNQPFFVELRGTLEAEILGVIKSAVETLIHSDAHPAKGQQGIIQRCFAIRSGENPLLDMIRKTYSERIDEMREYVQKLGTKYNMPLTVNNNNKKGYHIVLPLNPRQRGSFKKSELPEEFVQVDHMRTGVSMKTIELMSWEMKIDTALVEILKLSNATIYNLLVEIRKHVNIFYTICEGIGKLDMLQSLAVASCTPNYVRPNFDEFLEVVNARHPMLDFLCANKPVANTIFASDMHNTHIITGPNGAGKSIFIRQTLLLQVMAQVGSFVPADEATFRVCDRILARISFNDNMDFGVSTFQLEVKEIEYFHTVMSKNTLIIIDELGRSTSVEEGTALAMAICENLAKTSAFTFFTTHFSVISKLEDLYVNITNWQLETYIETTPEGREKLKYTYNLVRGVTNVQKYGLYCARASWPEDVIRYAEELMKTMHTPTAPTEIMKVNQMDRLKYNLEADLKILKFKKQLTFTNLSEKLYQYVSDLNEIGCDIDISEIAPVLVTGPSNSRQNVKSGTTINGSRTGLNRIGKDYPTHTDFRYDNEIRRSYQQNDVEMSGSGNYNAVRFSFENTYDRNGVNNDLAMSEYIYPEVVYSQDSGRDKSYAIENVTQNDDREELCGNLEYSRFVGASCFNPNLDDHDENQTSFRLNISYGSGGRNVTDQNFDGNYFIYDGHHQNSEYYESVDKENERKENVSDSTAGIGSSSYSINEKQFLLPLQINEGRTSTPIHQPVRASNFSDGSPVISVLKELKNNSNMFSVVNNYNSNSKYSTLQTPYNERLSSKGNDGKLRDSDARTWTRPLISLTALETGSFDSLKWKHSTTPQLFDLDDEATVEDFQSCNEYFEDLQATFVTATGARCSLFEDLDVPEPIPPSQDSSCYFSRNHKGRGGQANIEATMIEEERNCSKNILQCSDNENLSSIQQQYVVHQGSSSLTMRLAVTPQHTASDVQSALEDLESYSQCLKFSPEWHTAEEPESQRSIANDYFSQQNDDDVAEFGNKSFSQQNFSSKRSDEEIEQKKAIEEMYQDMTDETEKKVLLLSEYIFDENNRLIKENLYSRDKEIRSADTKIDSKAEIKSANQVDLIDSPRGEEDEGELRVSQEKIAKIGYDMIEGAANAEIYSISVQNKAEETFRSIFSMETVELPPICNETRTHVVNTNKRTKTVHQNKQENQNVYDIKTSKDSARTANLRNEVSFAILTPLAAGTDLNVSNNSSPISSTLIESSQKNINEGRKFCLSSHDALTKRTCGSNINSITCETSQNVGVKSSREKGNIFETSVDVSFSFADVSNDLIEKTSASLHHCASSSIEGVREEKHGKTRKFKPPIKTSVDRSERVPTRIVRSKYKPPSKLSKKKIQEQYLKQDMELLKNLDETNIEKYMQQVTNRPTATQLQRMEHIGNIQKTKTGVVFIPPPPTIARKRRNYHPLQRRDSGTNFDIKLFSDSNSDQYREFLATKVPKTESDFPFKFVLSERRNVGLFQNVTTTSNSAETSKEGASFLDRNFQVSENKGIEAVVSKYLENN